LKNQILTRCTGLSLQKGQRSFILMVSDVPDIKKKGRYIYSHTGCKKQTKNDLQRCMIFSFLPFAFLRLVFFCLNSLFYRARIETRSSLSEEFLQCSQGICETISNPYSFDDYAGIKEEFNGVGFKWEQTHSNPQCTAFSLPHDLYNFNPLKREVEESDFLKVGY